MRKRHGWLLGGVVAAIALGFGVWQKVAAQSIVGQSAMLFRYVTNQAGFDTGIAISNASFGKYGAAQKAGACFINYYGSTVGGGAAPPSQVTGIVPPGGQAVFTLSGGGLDGRLFATPGFQGYIIAICNFPLARGVAFISDIGAQKFFAPEPALPIPAF